MVGQLGFWSIEERLRELPGKTREDRLAEEARKSVPAVTPESRRLRPKDVYYGRVRPGLRVVLLFELPTTDSCVLYRRDGSALLRTVASALCHYARSPGHAGKG